MPDTLGPVQWTPLFRTPWDQYSGPPLCQTPWDQYSGPPLSRHLGTSTVEPSIPDTLHGTSTVDPSIPDTLGPVQWTPLFRTPWDQYSGPLYSGHLGTSAVDPSIPDTLGPVQWSPLFRTPWDQYSGALYSRHHGTRDDCPDYRNVLISGVKDVLWQSMVNHLVPVACVHIRGVSAIKGAGLEGFHWTPHSVPSYTYSP